MTDAVHVTNLMRDALKPSPSLQLLQYYNLATLNTTKVVEKQKLLLD